MPGLWRRPLEANRNDAGASNSPMLDAGNNLLTDEAAFVEIDAMELVHVAPVRKGVAIDEIHPAPRDA
jgi:hypothetical protein